MTWRSPSTILSSALFGCIAAYAHKALSQFVQWWNITCPWDLSSNEAVAAFPGQTWQLLLPPTSLSPFQHFAIGKVIMSWQSMIFYHQGLAPGKAHLFLFLSCFCLFVYFCSSSSLAYRKRVFDPIRLD